MIRWHSSKARRAARARGHVRSLWGIASVAVLLGFLAPSCDGGCSVEDGCKQGFVPFSCDEAETPAAMCKVVRAHEEPNNPDGYHGSRAEGCGYVSYTLQDWTGGVTVHYEAATGKLVGLQIGSEDPQPMCGARFGTVPDWTSCPDAVVCGVVFDPKNTPCDWVALCGP